MGRPHWRADVNYAATIGAALRCHPMEVTPNAHDVANVYARVPEAQEPDRNRTHDGRRLDAHRAPGCFGHCGNPDPLASRGRNRDQCPEPQAGTFLRVKSSETPSRTTHRYGHPGPAEHEGLVVAGAERQEGPQQATLGVGDGQPDDE